MKLIYNDIYSDESELIFDTKHLQRDLQRIGYDNEHIKVIIKALSDKADEKRLK